MDVPVVRSGRTAEPSELAGPNVLLVHHEHVGAPTVADRPSDSAVMVIEPSHGWNWRALRELWEYRELFFFLLQRDVKVRYKQTFFGVAWALLQPILLALVFSISLGRIAGVGLPTVPYPIFVLSGLVPWALFSQSVTSAANSLVGGEALVSKVYFPRLLLPLAAAASHLVDFGFSVAVLLVLMTVSGTAISVSVGLIPVLAAVTLFAAFGVGIFLSALNVRFRDVRHAVPFLVQVWFFATPIVYVSSVVPEGWRPLLALNPMTGVVAGFQWALIGGPPRGDLVVLAIAISLGFLVAALAYFSRAERRFADVI